MKKIKLFLSFTIILGWIATTFASAASGVAYLQSVQAGDGSIGGLGSTAWAVMALASRGETNTKAINALKTVQQSLDSRSATDIEKQILALVAGGETPRTFAGKDAVVALESHYAAGQYGDPDYLNDDIFGILALRAVNALVPAEAIANLASRQNSDGGFGLVVGGSSSSDMTAVALIALKGQVSSAQFEKAIAYLRARQNSDGGFAITTGSSSMGSTAWVTWFIHAYDYALSDWSKDSKSPHDFLLSKQEANGSWAESVLLTSYTVIALSGESFPIRGGDVVPSPSPSVSVVPSPVVSPSVFPSPVPSPVPSPSPSFSPSPSVAPSITPSPVGTLTPSAAPSGRPSPSPSVSTTSLSPTVTVSSSSSTSLATGNTATPVSTVLPVSAAISPTPQVKKMVAHAIPSMSPSARSTSSLLPSSSPSALASPSLESEPVAYSVQNVNDYLVHAGFGALLLTVNLGSTCYDIFQARKRMK